MNLGHFRVNYTLADFEKHHTQWG